VILGTTLRDVEQESRPVEGHDFEHRAVLTADRSVPFDVDDALPQALARATAFEQSSRCTDTPRPCVMNPMMLSPGTGEQQRASGS